MSDLDLKIEDFNREFETFSRDNQDLPPYECSTYDLERDLLGNSVNFNLVFENCENENHEKFIASSINKKISWIINNQDLIANHLADKMLELANDWRDEEEIEITKDDFKKRIHLSGFMSFFDEDFSIYYDDDFIFGGHQITLDVKDGFILDEDPQI